MVVVVIKRFLGLTIKISSVIEYPVKERLKSQKKVIVRRKEDLFWVLEHYGKEFKYLEKE